MGTEREPSLPAPLRSAAVPASSAGVALTEQQDAPEHEKKDVDDLDALN